MSPNAGWIDTHCHLPEGQPGREAVAEARAAGVTTLVDVGIDLASSQAAAARAGELEGVVATAGVHPHHASEGIAGIEDLLGHRAVVAVGETGLDYHYDHSPRPVQREAFAAQIALAHRWGLALVIHTREAWRDTFAVLDAEGVPERTVFHCFTGGPEEATACLDRGALVSFSGIVTFKNAENVREAARRVPVERLLVETDAPYLAPVPHRGRPNRPALVTLVGSAVAALKGVATEDLAARTAATATWCYGLSDR